MAQRHWGLEAVRTLAVEHLPLVKVEDVSADDRDAAPAALLTIGRRQPILVDPASFTVMRRLGIRRHLGCGPHFAEQGFAPIAKTSG